MKKIFALILIALLLAGCGSKSTPTLSESEIATKVAQVQTNMPAATTVVPKVVTATQSLPTVPVTPAAGSPTAAATKAATTAPTQPAATATRIPATATTASTATPAISATPAPPTATLAPSATLLPGDPRAALGNPTWKDSMANSDNWPTGEDAAGYTSIDFKNGALLLTALKPQAGWRLTFDKLTNFYLEMTVKTGTCTGEDNYGLIFRVPVKENPDRGYLAGFSCDGKFSLRKWDGPNNMMSALLIWKTNAAIKPGANQTNRLGVMVKGSRITVYANGVALGEVLDVTYKEGYFGIFAGAAKTTGFTISVGEIAYWNQ